MASVFISYASEDAAVARQLSEMLQADGQRVFFDHAIAAGADFSATIEKALANADAVVVLLSRNSNRSNWVQAEVRSALETGHVVIPVLLDEEATNNWVWPLVSDRQAVKIDSPAQVEEVVREVNRAVGGANSVVRLSPRSMSPSAARSRLAILLVAVLSAIAGAFIAWFAK